MVEQFHHRHFALTYIGSGFGGILMGWVVDRLGFAIPAFAGAIMVSLGGLLTSIVDQPWQLLAIYGVMFGLSGQGALAAPAMANLYQIVRTKKGDGRWDGVEWSGISGNNMAAHFWLGSRPDRLERSLLFVWSRGIDGSFARRVVCST